MPNRYNSSQWRAYDLGTRKGGKRNKSSEMNENRYVRRLGRRRGQKRINRNFDLLPSLTLPAIFPIWGNDNSTLLVPQPIDFSHPCPHAFHQELLEALPSKYIWNPANTQYYHPGPSHNHLSPELVHMPNLPPGSPLCLTPVFNVSA